MSSYPEPGMNLINRESLSRLRAVAGSGPVLITSHNNPDPDSLAAGEALAKLLDFAWGIASQLVYGGMVARAENKAMLRLLTPNWEKRENLTNLSQYSALILVDSQPGAGNNNLPLGVYPNIVIDHHYPEREGLEFVSYVDVRPSMGATVSMVYQYLDAAGVQIETRLATAIFYGIQADTRGLSRGSSPADQAIYFKLLRLIDLKLLSQVEQAGLPRDYYRAFNKGLQASQIYGSVVATYLGDLIRPDFVAEMADLLIRLEQTKAVICMGYHGTTMFVSLRTISQDYDAGSLIQKVITAPGTAGGHNMMAGGQVPLSGRAADEVAAEIVRQFLKVMGESSWGEALI